jgi:hypothetical protein
MIAQESLLLPACGRTKPPTRRICDARPPSSDAQGSQSSRPDTTLPRAAQSVCALAKAGRKPAKGGRAIFDRASTVLDVLFLLHALPTAAVLLASPRAFGHTDATDQANAI